MLGLYIARYTLEFWSHGPCTALHSASASAQIWGQFARKPGWQCRVAEWPQTKHARLASGAGCLQTWKCSSLPIRSWDLSRLSRQAMSPERFESWSCWPQGLWPNYICKGPGKPRNKHPSFPIYSHLWKRVALDIFFLTFSTWPGFARASNFMHKFKEHKGRRRHTRSRFPDYVVSLCHRWYPRRLQLWQRTKNLLEELCMFPEALRKVSGDLWWSQAPKDPKSS